MNLHYQVRSVLLSQNSSAVTLDPVAWFRESATETELDEDGTLSPKLIDVDDPSDGDDVLTIGGAKTELRFDETTDLQPGEYVTVSYRRTL